MWIPSSSHRLCIAITLILGTLTTDSEGKEAEACHVDPSLRVVELKCDTGHINIGSIQVGYAHGSCASMNCEYHLVGAQDGAEYLTYLHNLCNNEQDCTVSSEYLLSNISQRKPPRVFSACWSSAQHLRNKVKLNYTCSVFPLTSTEAGPAGNTDDTLLTSTTTNSPSTNNLSNLSHSLTDGPAKDNSAMEIAVPLAIVASIAIIVVVVLVIFRRKRMCLWKEKSASLAGIQPAREIKHKRDSLQQQHNYESTDDQYHVLDETAQYYNSATSLTNAETTEPVHQDNIYSLPASQCNTTLSPMSEQQRSGGNTSHSNLSYTEHCIMATPSAADPTAAEDTDEYSIAEDAPPVEKGLRVKQAPVYTQVNKNRTGGKNQLASADNNNAHNNLIGNEHSGEADPELIVNDIYETASPDLDGRDTHHQDAREVTELVDNDLYDTDG